MSQRIKTIQVCVMDVTQNELHATQTTWFGINARRSTSDNTVALDNPGTHTSLLPSHGVNQNVLNASQIPRSGMVVYWWFIHVKQAARALKLNVGEDDEFSQIVDTTIFDNMARVLGLALPPTSQ